jgi:putative transposase
MRYRFIRDQAPAYPVTVLCHVLQVPRSGYYAWRRAPESARTQADRPLLVAITAVHTDSRQTYGSPRVQAQLQQQGTACGRHRVARLMRTAGLTAQRHRPYRVTTNARHALPVAANVLDRQFTPARPNQVWASDITYIPTREGWLYLAVVIDLHSRRVVGWALSPRIDRTLVCDALTAACRARRPAPGLLHHSDRGSPYASGDYQALLATHRMIPSMSRKGNCWDNAPLESFFHSLKGEWLNDQTFPTRAAARQAIFRYIAVWYNRHRLHSTLGYRSPEAFEQAYKQVIAA